MKKFDVLIVGGGTGGLTVASQLANRGDGAPSLGIIEPSDKHYYQPIWTLVGGGVFPKETSERDQADYIPAGATWLRDTVASFDPAQNVVTLASGESVGYEQLVVAAGIQLDWGKVEGLPDSLGRHGIVSNYSYAHVDKTWETIRQFRGGKALFTFPNTPIKCAGAPQKIMYLAEEAFRRNGVRDRSEVAFYSAGGAIFGVPKYRAALEKIIDARRIQTAYKQNLVALKAEQQQAIFQDVDDGSQSVVSFDMIHVTPPQSAPDFIKQSPLANDAGWVDVDKHSLQHTRFPNVFSLGDCSSLPTSKTGAAVRKEAPVLVENLMAYRTKRPLTGHYDGYASCPLITGYGKAILAEFGYDGKIMETFDVDQAEERFSMYMLKAYGLPKLYWNGMLRGRM